MKRIENIARFLLIGAVVVGLTTAASAQSLSHGMDRSTKREARLNRLDKNDVGYEHYPVFGMFRENSFSTGMLPAERLSPQTADVRFQVSVALRVFRLAPTADMLFTYTQRSVWDIYQESCPFRENAYNPGIWFPYKPHRQVQLMFGVEHESNGMGGAESRSWNYVSAACLYAPNEYFDLGLQLWYGYYDKEGNPNWFRYRGYGAAWASYHTADNRFAAMVWLNPSHGFRNWNVKGEIAIRLTTKHKVVPSIFIQYMGGYAQTMINYNRFDNSVRIGISVASIRPTLR